jgi:prepilin-type N-terminal cleavage/methylation domain-containing protein
MKTLHSNVSPFLTSKKRGLTLIEMMVAMGIGVILLTGITVIFITGLRSYLSMGNYIDMNLKSRSTLDRLTRDIRKSKDVVSCTPSMLVLDYDGTTHLTYSYDANARALTRQIGNLTPDTLLTRCDQLEFKMYQKSPQAGGDFLMTTNIAQAKSINVNWQCSRLCFGVISNTEGMLQASVVIRNKLAN